MAFEFKNNAISTLLAAITSSQTSITIVTPLIGAFSSPASGNLIACTLKVLSTHAQYETYKNYREIIYYSVSSNNVLTVLRNREGSAAPVAGWPAGTTIFTCIPAAFLNSLATEAWVATYVAENGGEGGGLPVQADWDATEGDAVILNKPDLSVYPETEAVSQALSGKSDVGHTHSYEPLKGEDDNFVTDAEKTKLSNLSGTNTGDQDLSGKSDVGHTHSYEPLKGEDDNFVTDAEKTKLSNLSGTNTGDQDLSGLMSLTGDQSATGTKTFASVVMGATAQLTGAVSPAQITANQNDYNPTGLSTASTLRLNSDASRDVTGLQGGASGRLLLIHNIGSFDIVLKNASSSSTAAYRFDIGADFTLGSKKIGLLQYDSTSERWRLVNDGINATPVPATIPFFFPEPTAGDVCGFMTPDFAITLAATDSDIRSITANGPVGADFIIDIEIYTGGAWATIYSTQANRPKITDGQTIGTVATPDTTSIPAKTPIRAVIDQVGSTTAGSNIAFTLGGTR